MIILGRRYFNVMWRGGRRGEAPGAVKGAGASDGGVIGSGVGGWGDGGS